GSIAGMLGGLLIADRAPARDKVEGAARRFRAFRQSPLPSLGRSASRGLARAIPVNERFQAVLHPWSGYVVVPLFALANAGVDLRGGVLGDALRSPVTWGVVLGLVLGKPLGIAGATFLGRRLGLGELPAGVRPGHVMGGAALSGIGFTVSLLIAHLAFTDEELQDQAQVGVLIALVLATALGWLVFVTGRVFRGEGDADLPRRLAEDVDPEVDHVKGRPDAPLTIVEYADYECPFCGRVTGPEAAMASQLGDDLAYVVGPPRPRPPPGRAGSGRCTGCWSSTRTTWSWRTSSSTPRSSTWTSTGSSPTWRTRRPTPGSAGTSAARRPAGRGAPRRSSSTGSGTSARTTRRPSSGRSRPPDRPRPRPHRSRPAESGRRLARLGLAAEPGQPGPQRLLPAGVAVEPQVALPEDGEQRVVEPAYRAGRVAVDHPVADRGAVHRGQQSTELVQRGDAQLQQQARDPGVVLGARPSRVRVLPGQERSEVLGADPRVGGVVVRRGAGAGAQPLP